MKPSTSAALLLALAVKVVLIGALVFRAELSPAVSEARAASPGVQSVGAEPQTVAEAPPEAASEAPEPDGPEAVPVAEQLPILVHQQAQLRREQEELAAVKKEIEEKIEALTRLREEIRSDLARKEALENGKLKHLVKIYSAMKPQNAADLIASLDTAFAVELLSQMRGETVGAILTCLDGEKAAGIVKGLADR